MKKKFAAKKLTWAATSAVVVLALTACGSGTQKLEDVDYDMKGATAEPSVGFETPFAATGNQTHIIEDGSGDQVNEGDALVLNASVFSGADGKSQGSTYTSSPLIIEVNDQLKENAPEIYDVVSQAKVGTSFSYTTNTTMGQDGTKSTSSPGSATNVEVYTISQKLPSSVEGEQKDLGADKPKFTLEGNKATLTLPENKGDEPKEVVTDDLITGNGETVNEGDTVYARYIGVTWNDGKVFDQNYDAAPAAFQLNKDSLVEGWVEGLAGKKVGSRVMVTIPTDKAYGENAKENQMPEGPLVFVVDILGRSDAPAATETQSAPAETGEASSAPAQSETPQPEESK